MAALDALEPGIAHPKLQTLSFVIPEQQSPAHFLGGKHATSTINST